MLKQVETTGKLGGWVIICHSKSTLKDFPWEKERSGSQPWRHPLQRLHLPEQHLSPVPCHSAVRRCLQRVALRVCSLTRGFVNNWPIIKSLGLSWSIIILPINMTMICILTAWPCIAQFQTHCNPGKPNVSHSPSMVGEMSRRELGSMSSIWLWHLLPHRWCVSLAPAASLMLAASESWLCSVLMLNVNPGWKPVGCLLYFALGSLFAAGFITTCGHTPEFIDPGLAIWVNSINSPKAMVFWTFVMSLQKERCKRRNQAKAGSLRFQLMVY